MNNYDFMPGVPAAGHVAGGCWHPGAAAASGVRVTRLDRAYLVGWPRVLTHSPRARTGKAAGDA